MWLFFWDEVAPDVYERADKMDIWLILAAAVMAVLLVYVFARAAKNKR